MKNKILMMFWVILFSLTVTTLNVSANENKAAINTRTLNVSAKGAMAVDAKTGQVLYDKNGNRQVPIASVSKLVTAYIVLEKIDAKQLSWNTKIKISPAIAQLSHNSVYTNVPLQEGHYYTVKQLYQASLICSANAAAMALGNYISGNSTDFGNLMDKTLHKLGIKNYHIYNACGLANVLLGAELKNPKLNNYAENEMSAAALAKFARILLAKHPEILTTTKMKNLNWNGINHPNTDALLNETDGDFTVDGLKTGTSQSAGGNFVGTGYYNNDSRIITVVLGADIGNQFKQTDLIVASISQHLQMKNKTKVWIPYKK